MLTWASRRAYSREAIVRFRQAQQVFLDQTGDNLTTGLYKWQQERGGSSPLRDFSIHDQAIGVERELDMGDYQNKVIKDIQNRFQLSQGKRIHFRLGIDCWHPEVER